MGPFASGPGACPSCEKGKGLVFRGAVAVCRYEGVAREMVHRFKYGGDTRAARWMAGQMAAQWRRAPWGNQVQVVVPVPLHWSRRIRRRFNQSELLARAMGREAEARCEPGILRRTRKTHAQFELSLAERARNVSGAFRVARPASVKGQVVLLVDDVMTTCATATECARVLRAAGAKRVFVAVFAR